MSHIVSQEWLLDRIGADESSLVLLDIRFSSGDPDYGQNAYRRGHLPGAIFIDLKKDLSASVQQHGGRSPLPELEQLAAFFGKLGIDRKQLVVIYDDDLRPEAARLWWILTYLGHEEAYILDGGYSRWEAAVLPVTTEIPVEPEPSSFEVRIRPELLADVNEVKAALGRSGTVLVDSRDFKQYIGEEAPFDPAAGHIPGAIHAFWKDGIQGSGSLKPREEQLARFQSLQTDQEIIVYCGSGMSACPNVLALKEAGFTNVKLYAGSWSDWISYGENPIATGEE
ncbi:sulfurtransferase [Paenibacillus dakarensis]|uniref:sulfurtransferase n=1 Tax=Paenibacillus dakarensis TaxID=1527293 RepID=UPI0006D5B166|nr:sulfurtransferase [Paenibacillus dakarensis]